MARNVPMDEDPNGDRDVEEKKYFGSDFEKLGGEKKSAASPIFFSSVMASEMIASGSGRFFMKFH